MAKPTKELRTPSPKPRTRAAAPTTAEAQAAFTRVRADIDALPRDETRRLNVHVPTAVSVALGALPRLRALRDEMRALPGHPADTLVKLRDYALAAAYAHVLTLPGDEGETSLRALLNEAMPLRERLLLGAEALAQFGLVDRVRVAAIRRGAGHLDAAQDLTALGAVFREAWPRVAAKTPLTLPEIERGAELGALLLEALGQRKQGTDGSADPGEAHERLAKAYELLFRTYDECRRAVQYLRWHQGDAATIAPSLQQGRRRERSAPPAGGDDGAPGEGEPDGDEAGEGEPGEGELEGGLVDDAEPGAAPAGVDPAGGAKAGRHAGRRRPGGRREEKWGSGRETATLRVPSTSHRTPHSKPLPHVSRGRYSSPRARRRRSRFVRPPKGARRSKPGSQPSLRGRKAIRRF